MDAPRLSPSDFADMVIDCCQYGMPDIADAGHAIALSVHDLAHKYAANHPDAQHKIARWLLSLFLWIDDEQQRRYKAAKEKP